MIFLIWNCIQILSYAHRSKKGGDFMATKEHKQLSCRDFGVDCDFMVRAQTEEEVISLATEHACRIHSKCEIPSDQSEIKRLIKSVWV